LNFDNGHRPRQGQHNNNKNRNRGRNNRRPSGGGGNSPNNNSGGNSLNRVYESNGPDVKVRGTAQTVAEKYLQLGRDAQSSGDNVMAESYFQFSEHYFRTWAAAQPVGQPTQQLRRPDDEEFEDDREEGGEGETEGAAAPEGAPPASVEHAEMTAEPSGSEPDGEQRNFRQRDNRERNRPKWQNRRDQPNQDQPGEGDPRAVEGEAVVEARVASSQEEAASGEWEAPSFLRRPAPVVEEAGAEAVPAAEKRARAPRRPRAAADETPQGE
jgi:Domain of unknown function (DUF4167)